MLFRVVAGVAAVFGTAELNADGAARMEDAKPFVTSLYERYQKGSILLESPTMIYSPELVREMQRARRQRISFQAPRDPLCNCSQHDVTAVKVTITPLAEGKADAAVAFRNFGKKQRVALTLVDVNGEWRVDDIRTAGQSIKPPAPLASLAR